MNARWPLLSIGCAWSLRALADPNLFAAPGAQNAAPPGSVASYGQMTFALLIVLALVFVAAWALRKMRAIRATQPGRLQVVAQVALGAKERAVIVRVNDVHVLVGVAPGRVSALHTWSAPPEDLASAPEAAQTDTPSFQSLLKKSLGLKP